MVLLILYSQTMLSLLKEKWFTLLLLSVAFAFSSLFWTKSVVYDRGGLGNIELGWPVVFVVQDYSSLEPPVQWFPGRIGLGAPQEYPLSFRFLSFFFSLTLSFLVVFCLVFAATGIISDFSILRREVSTKYVLAATGVIIFALVAFSSATTRVPPSRTAMNLQPPYVPPPQPVFLEYHPFSAYPTEWRTFVSQKLGFSFEYPAEWGTVTEEIIDYAGRQNQADHYIASAGKGYSLLFSYISNVPYEYRVYGVGQSVDFAAGRESIPTDYKGDPKRPASIISEVGINLTARCSDSGYPAGLPASHAIKLNLLGKEISGAMLVFPVLSVADTKKYNQIIDDFMRKEISCSDIRGDNAGGEKAKQIMAKLIAKEKEISEMLRVGENFDKESRVNLMVYNRILKSAKFTN